MIPNFESFDLWSKAQFAMWSNVRHDFELIAELIRYRKSARVCLELLDTINRYIKNAPQEVFFDGTVRSLKYLVKNNYLNISDLPNLTHDEKYLVELLKKYSKKLTITEVFSDIEEPALRATILEYPHLLKETLEDELGRCLINQALLKNDITDEESFVQKVDDGANDIEVDKDKYSKEAMKCKIIYVGLWLNNKKISITKNCTEIIKLFSTLTDQLIESEDYAKGIINSLYVSLYGSSEWNKDKKMHLSGCDILYTDFILLSSPDNHMSMIYEMLLKEETEKIGRKYFGEKYKPEGFVASLAIKMAIVIILFRSGNFMPKDEKAEVNFFGKGAMLDGLNYGVKIIEEDGKKSLQLKKWFLDYYQNELDKRMAFIKLQVDNCIALTEIRSGITRVIYLPVFESFRFFCSKTPKEVLEQIIKLFKNQAIDNGIKDDILINFVINIQKIIGVKRLEEKEITEEEKYFKDAFILLISKTFENLVKKIIRSLELQTPIKSYYEKSYEEKHNLENDDLFGDANVAIMELIWNFDLSKNDSFIGYLSYNLRLKIITSSRIKKSDQYITLEHDLEEGFLENIPGDDDFIKQLNNQEDMAKIQKYTDNLPEKQKEAIRRIQEGNDEAMSDADRQNRSRGLNKIRKMMAES
ncbi:MAG TPA: hypothetical protein PLK76_02565 [bacterium]|nr:hypothetical protein [bacterium]